MVMASYNTASNVEKTISLLSLGKVVMLILTLKWVSSWRSQTSGSKEEASIKSQNARAVALPGIMESERATYAARLRRPPPAERIDIKGVIYR